MNIQRRKYLKEIHTRLSDTVERLRNLATEEEEYRDNLPENMQSGEKYDLAETAAYSINDAADTVENALETLEEAWT